jgi:hypothetical protein
MKTNAHEKRLWRSLLPLFVMAWTIPGNAQVAVDDDGNAFDDYDEHPAGPVTGNEDIPLLSTAELESLVGPIALYPDDLLAVVLPASTFPLQVIQAKRFLDEIENDPSLQPDESWDDAVVALTNYPEVVDLLNEDLDWTWRLGEAVVAQQTDVIAAIETFRDRAYAAGNLQSDAHQNVARNDGVIEISPVEDDVIYVPYYEPERVVVYQPRPVYYYHPTAYPVYYYPYPAGHSFHSGFFWGVTTAFTIGWYTDSLNVFHHSYHGHPYYGYSYWDRWWYRSPSLHVHNTIYLNRHTHRSHDYYRSGDYWRPHARRTLRHSDQRITRSRYYPGDAGDARHTSTYTAGSGSRESRRGSAHAYSRGEARPDVRLSERPETRSSSGSRREARDDRDTVQRERSHGKESNRGTSRPGIRFKDRPAIQARSDDSGASRNRGNGYAPDRDPGVESRAYRIPRSEPKRQVPEIKLSDRRQEPQRRGTGRTEPSRRDTADRARVARGEPRQAERSADSRPSRPETRQSRQRSEPQRNRSRSSKPERVASVAKNREDGRRRR